MEAEFFSVGFSHISFVLSLFRQVFINQPCHPWLSWITQCLIPVQCFGWFSVMTLRVVPKQSSDPSRMPWVSALHLPASADCFECCGFGGKPMKDHEQDHPTENVVFWYTSLSVAHQYRWKSTFYIILPKAQMNFGSAHKATGWKHWVTEPHQECHGWSSCVGASGEADTKPSAAGLECQ